MCERPVKHSCNENRTNKQTDKRIRMKSQPESRYNILFTQNWYIWTMQLNNPTVSFQWNYCNQINKSTTLRLIFHSNEEEKKINVRKFLSKFHQIKSKSIKKLNQRRILFIWMFREIANDFRMDWCFEATKSQVNLKFSVDRAKGKNYVATAASGWIQHWQFDFHSCALALHKPKCNLSSIKLHFSFSLISYGRGTTSFAVAAIEGKIKWKKEMSNK